MALRGWVGMCPLAGLVELVERADNRQPADELGNEPVLDSCPRVGARGSCRPRASLSRLDVRPEAERLLADAPFDDLVEADEGPAADEEDVGRVDLEELLVRVLAAPLRRDVRDRALQDLEQRLLHALARDVAGDRGVLVLAADLVDFVDVDDALLALLDVAPAACSSLRMMFSTSSPT